MNHNLPLLYITLFFLLLTLPANSQTKKRPAVKTVTTTTLEEHVGQLMADRVDLKREIIVDKLASIDYHSLEELLREENLEFPADELYNSDWDNRWVNPFRGKSITVPDSFDINCSSFRFPLDNIKVTSQFGPRRRRMHNGVDFKLQIGDTVRAAFSGKVRIKSFERRGYGNYIVIRHPNGLETVYGHLSQFLISENEIIQAGQPIGLGGNTGRSTGPHLHFEMRFLGSALNPNHLIDVENGVPQKDIYLFTKSNLKNNNSYTSTSSRIVYHRVKKGETLGSIARKHRTTINELCRINGIKRNGTLRIGQSLRCGTVAVKQPQATSSKTSETPTPAESKMLYHKVQNKETLSSIARKYGTSVEALCLLNKIQSTSSIRLGQQIAYKKVNVAPANQAPSVSKESAASSTAPIKAQQKKSDTNLHRVKHGETLYSISRRYNLSTEELCRINGITQQTIIKTGQQLRYRDEAKSASLDRTTTDNEI